MHQIILALTSQKQNQKLEKVFSSMGYEAASAYDYKIISKTMKEYGSGIVIVSTQTSFVKKLLTNNFKKTPFWNLMLLGEEKQVQCFLEQEEEDKQHHYLALPCKGRDVIEKTRKILDVNVLPMAKRADYKKAAPGKIVHTGDLVDMTAQETALFEVFLETPGEILSREELFQKAWGSCDVGASRTVDVHVQRLRKKLGESGRIETVYNQGYRLAL